MPLYCFKNAKVKMYEKFGFVNQGIADSTWGGETWYEMRYTLGVG